MVANVGMIGTFSNMCYVTFDWYGRVDMKIGVSGCIEATKRFI